MKVLIDGKEANFFSKVELTLKLDAIASEFEFSTRFDPTNNDNQELLKPLQYKDVLIYSDTGKLLLTGTIVNHVFESDSAFDLVIVSGYSKSGILNDVTIPLNDNSLESTSRSFIDIARKLCAIYGVDVVVSDQAKSISDGAVTSTSTLKEKSEFESVKARSESVFGRTSAEPTETVKDYLSKLAGQKNLILTHNEKGQVLVFQPSYNQKPKYFLNKGNSLKMKATFNGQGMHSDIFVVREPSDENEGASTLDVIKNTLIKKYRPTTKTLSSGGDTDTSNSIKNELASELKGIQVSVDLEGLFEDIYPGEIVNVHNHYIYSFAYNRFMVDQIKLTQETDSNKTTLELLLPETFTGGPLIRNILFNHLDEDYHYEPELNEVNSRYTNDKSIL